MYLANLIKIPNLFYCLRFYIFKSRFAKCVIWLSSLLFTGEPWNICVILLLLFLPTVYSTCIIYYLYYIISIYYVWSSILEDRFFLCCCYHCHSNVGQSVSSPFWTRLNISKTIEWIAKTFCTDIYGSQRMIRSCISVNFQSFQTLHK